MLFPLFPRPTSHLNSDTLYLAVTSDLSVWGSGLTAQSYKLPLTLESIKSPGCHLCFWPNGNKSVAGSQFLCSIHLLERQIELREPACLLDYWLMRAHVRNSQRGELEEYRTSFPRWDWLFHHWPLGMDSTSRLSALPGGQVWVGRGWAF